MTEGHKHRVVHVDSFDLWWVRALRAPLLHRYAFTDDAWLRIDRSPYPYGPCPPERGLDADCWTLSLLGIIHRFTGLVLDDGPVESSHEHRT